MSMLPTDEELLSCPEAVELSFIHRGRQDIIAPHAGKELLGRGFSIFLIQVTWSLAIYLSLKSSRFLLFRLVACIP